MSEKRAKFPVTVQLLLKKENKILLQKRHNTGYADGMYGFVGGHIENGEEIREAMAREAKEEIGIDIEPKDLKVIHVMNRKIEDREYIDFVLTTVKWNGKEKINEPEKCSELKWFDLDKLPENIIDFEKELLKENNNFYIPWGWDKQFFKV